MKIETIVVTGNIGSGKSSIISTIKSFVENKVEFFSFDEFTKELYENDEVKRFLMLMFGTTQKSAISDMAFASSVMKEMLDKFFFKFVEQKFLDLVNREDRTSLVIEFPLFFEMERLSIPIQLVRSKVKVIVVACDDEVRVARVKNRDNFDEVKIQSIMASQMAQADKIEKADYVVDTTNGQCDDYVRDLLKHKFKGVFYNVST